jgi:hypothetical protein
MISAADPLAWRPRIRREPDPRQGELRFNPAERCENESELGGTTCAPSWPAGSGAWAAGCAGRKAGKNPAAWGTAGSSLGDAHQGALDGAPDKASVVRERNLDPDQGGPRVGVLGRVGPSGCRRGEKRGCCAIAAQGN